LFYSQLAYRSHSPGLSAFWQDHSRKRRLPSENQAGERRMCARALYFGATAIIAGLNVLEDLRDCEVPRGSNPRTAWAKLLWRFRRPKLPTYSR
jgi:hypothetical protein